MGRLTHIQFMAGLLLFAVQYGTTQSGSKLIIGMILDKSEYSRFIHSHTHHVAMYVSYMSFQNGCSLL